MPTHLTPLISFLTKGDELRVSSFEYNLKTIDCLKSSTLKELVEQNNQNGTGREVIAIIITIIINRALSKYEGSKIKGDAVITQAFDMIENFGSSFSIESVLLMFKKARSGDFDKDDRYQVLDCRLINKWCNFFKKGQIDLIKKIELEKANEEMRNIPPPNPEKIKNIMQKFDQRFRQNKKQESEAEKIKRITTL